MHHPTDTITHTTAFVTPVVEHWLEREISQILFTGCNIKMTKDTMEKDENLNTFYLWLYGRGHMVKNIRILRGRKEMFHLTTHSTHFIYGYMAEDIW